MQTLFPVDPEYPPGFTYVPDFISKEEECFFIDEISKIALHNFTFRGYTAHRQVASFGFDYSFETKKLAQGKAIPPVFKPLMDRVGKYTNIPTERFAELLLTAYPVGSVINWHRDAPPFDVIAGISFGADCNFRLRPHDPAKQNRSSIVSLQVQRRSLYVMQAQARTDWQHSISPVKEFRYSITLRTLSNSEQVLE